MKSQKGITMASLVTSIIVLIILASVATYAGLQAYSDVKVEAFVNKMKVVQKRVDLISQEYLTWNGRAGNIDTSANADASFTSYLTNDLGFRKLNTVSGDSHASALSKIVTDGKYQSVTSAGEYYYFTPDDLKAKLGIDTLSDAKFYVAVYFANPLSTTTSGAKKNYVVEETGVKIKEGDTNKTYHEYYSINR